MKRIGRNVVVLLSVLGLLAFAACGPSSAVAAKPAKAVKSAKTTEAPDELGKPKAAVDIKKMADMSDFDRPAGFLRKATPLKLPT